jgi:hypothetical protein
LYEVADARRGGRGTGWDSHLWSSLSVLGSD